MASNEAGSTGEANRLKNSRKRKGRNADTIQKERKQDENVLLRKVPSHMTKHR